VNRLIFVYAYITSVEKGVSLVKHDIFYAEHPRQV